MAQEKETEKKLDEERKQNDDDDDVFNRNEWMRLYNQV